MKKVVGTFLCLTLLMMALSGCSSKQVESNPSPSSKKEVIELNYWTPLSGGDGDFMTSMVEKFNTSQTEIKVTLQNNVWADYYTKLRTSLVSDTAPDIAIAHASHLLELDKTGKLTNIDDFAKEAGVNWGDFAENPLKATIIDGKHVAIPNDTHCIIMYYNTDYFKTAGLLDENGKIIMDDGADGFIQMLEKVKAVLPAGAYPFVSATDNVCAFWNWYALYSQIDGGGEFIKDNKAAFNNEPARKAAQVLVDLRDKGLWPKNISDESAYDLFKTGKAAVHFAGVWATGNYESNKDLHFAAVPLPKIFDKEATWGDSHTLIIPKQDNKEKEIAAAKFANWLTSDGIDWAAAGHVPSKTTVTESSEFKALKYRPDYAKAIETVNYYPQITNISGVTDAVIADFVAMMKGNLTVDQTINKAAEDVNAILAK
mgnify:CR=1 FL=1|jgi:multiple sugar transport system substrate-binding protein